MSTGRTSNRDTRYDSAGMDALVQDFLRRAQAAVETSQEKLADDIENRINEALSAEIMRARKTIRAPFQRLISTRFPRLGRSIFARTILSVASRAEERRIGQMEPESPVGPELVLLFWLL